MSPRVAHEVRERGSLIWLRQMRGRGGAKKATACLRVAETGEAMSATDEPRTDVSPLEGTGER